MINFIIPQHQQTSKKKRFGICDNISLSGTKAYLDEANGGDWIAVIENFYHDTITFTPIDNCIEIRRPDNLMDNRCDGFLFYNNTIIFLELKDRNEVGNKWIKDGENQLRVTIAHFEGTKDASRFNVKRAYISNKARPLFRSSQIVRMNNFFLDTKYVLRIETRIEID